MRKRFEQQTELGRLLIQDTQIPTVKRNGPLPGLYAALKKLFSTPEYSEKVFNILEEKILSKNNTTGRPGMDLWQILVLAQVRLCKNTTYDELHYMANQDRLLRQLLGIEIDYSFKEHSSLKQTEITYQKIIDNVSLLDDKDVRELNKIIIDFGHEVFKKKEEEALSLKTDSFVVESNVHFPTDYNLLWDSARKCLDMIKKLQKRHSIKGWRKIENWHNSLKNKARALGKASSSGGKNKAKRLAKATEDYLTKSKTLLSKLKKDKANLPQEDIKDLTIVLELERFMELLEKHIDLVERRLIKGEQIPHKEKLFSIFEQYTEWVNKGKKHPNVELGKKVAITTDQFNLVVDYQVMENQSDSEIVSDLSNRIKEKYKVKSWSFDKGFWHKNNKELLSEYVTTLVMPKKGKCNKAEAEEERKPLFKKFRNKHSAVESNINELEYRGLDRCPDRGLGNFKRYVGLSIGAYNLKKIGEKLLEQVRKQEAAREKRKAA